MIKKAAFIHSTPVTVEDLKKVFSDKFPDVQLINIIDDSLLPEATLNGGITPDILRRMTIYALEAQNMGASVILNVCTTIGPGVDTVRKILKIPYVRIDEPMMKKAVELGERIAVIATAKTTVEPSSLFLENTAKMSGKNVIVKRVYVEKAFDALLIERDIEKHNRLVIEKVTEAAKDSDVIVLSQGSMMHLIPMLKHIKMPILTSVDLGIEQLRKYL